MELLGSRRNASGSGGGNPPSVCVALTQRQEAEKRIKFPVLKAWANTVQDVLV